MLHQHNSPRLEEPNSAGLSQEAPGGGTSHSVYCRGCRLAAEGQRRDGVGAFPLYSRVLSRHPARVPTPPGSQERSGATGTAHRSSAHLMRWTEDMVTQHEEPLRGARWLMEPPCSASFSESPLLRGWCCLTVTPAA